MPVLGVTPYLHVDIEDEDSLTERFIKTGSGGKIDIAVIRTPRISNFTDFLALEHLEEVTLRYVEHPGQLKRPDMILLPGTKNTMGDLKWMRENGLEAAILKEADQGTVIFGICGGYQMLGEELRDPDQVEEGGTMAGSGTPSSGDGIYKGKNKDQGQRKVLPCGWGIKVIGRKRAGRLRDPYGRDQKKGRTGRTGSYESDQRPGQRQEEHGWIQPGKCVRLLYPWHL